MYEVLWLVTSSRGLQLYPVWRNLTYLSLVPLSSPILTQLPLAPTYSRLYIRPRPLSSLIIHHLKSPQLPPLYIVRPSLTPLNPSLPPFNHLTRSHDINPYDLRLTLYITHQNFEIVFLLSYNVGRPLLLKVLSS